MQVFAVDRNGRHPLELQDGDRIARGGAGTIFRVNVGRFDDSVAKIFHRSVGIHRPKIEAMIAAPPSATWMTIHGRKVPQFAWPTHLIETGSGDGIGFLMPYIDRSMAVSMTEYVEDVNSLPLPDRSITLRTTVARNLAAAIAALHRQRNYFIDLKPQNILVFRETGNVCLLDCDGYAIDGSRFPAEQYSSQYLAPEILINRVSPEALSLNDYQDRFALAVILFQIMNYGVHPFQGIPFDKNIEEATTDEFTKRGWYPYGISPNPNLAPTIYSIHEYWDDGTRGLFDRAFSAARPSTRPTAADWSSHFDRLLQTKAFATCPRHPKDVQHLHFKGRPCFVCEKIAASPLPPQLPQRRTKWLGRVPAWVWWGLVIFTLIMVISNS